MIYALTEIEARYQETDQMGVIYHGNYATWFEVARTDYIRKLGLDYAEMEQAGVVSPVTELNIQYKKSVTYPEKVIIKTWVSRFSRLRSRYQYEIYNAKGELVTTGYTVNVIITKDAGKPVRLDKAFPSWYTVYHDVDQRNQAGEDLEVKSSDID
ncbi:TPA: acyl-CoA thioesterase [Staphylococcus pseudintermedius]|uniref:1,4-dihydroxy-2-naphthoyl-CoA hydrolase MenI n=1 Tax=Staphylococcus pseudintermedius TaxID=283734 RepID=UPI001655806D|nr:thioesterase family protein [Staphylococcus pseudintermedius]EGQ2995992.1 acyl-CoA thioesterase [Staphylococcus pseudintermedius]EJD8448197.1 acyl-CoA thioesterase [Staphylococcus pseudintermedius]EKA2859205.1 acyl-CoA thioesterase [Staphylococcus pseudintermedius]MBC8668737.1 acyl-CoA thioesterase [Staphylococcus pseudintermedius]MDK3835336.1 thioesterase family protein [Staphylococcus pseudintermedius]